MFRQTNSNAYPESMSLDGAESKGLQESSELFARFFRANFIQSSSHVAMNELSICALHVSSLSVTEDQVRSKLTLLDAGKGAGPDRIPPLFLKACADSLALPLTLIFNASLRQGVFPEIWKKAFITPIHKTGNRSLITNYRPISTLCSVAKVFETFVTDLLSSTYNPLLSPTQHGFVKNRSTCTNLVTFTDAILPALERGSEVHTVYTDFKKAFDRVDHRLLLKKLAALGVGGSLFDWLQSYLTGRTQVVRLKTCYSSEAAVTSGVPQGSHLGPLLFNLFINDVAGIFKSAQHLLYADDLKLYKEVRTTDDCKEMQTDLDALTLWCRQNNLQLNVTKCKLICYSRKVQPITRQYYLDGMLLQEVSSISDLGVVLSKDLSCTEHVNLMVHKALKTVGFIKRITRDFNDPACLRTLYCSLVRSTLEYASVVWAPHQSTLVDLIENVQHNFTRYAIYKVGLDSAMPRMERSRELGLPALADRRISSDLCFLYKICNGILDVPDYLSRISLRVPQRPTRSVELFAEYTHRTNYCANLLTNRLPRLYNEAARRDGSIDIFGMSLSVFRRRIANAFQ